MNLRNYVGKQINVQKVLDYEYKYWEMPNRCVLNINVTRVDDQDSEDIYSLQLELRTDWTKRVESITRMQNGLPIKRFPAAVEAKAESVLTDISLPTRDDVADFSILKNEHIDRYKY